MLAPLYKQGLGKLFFVVFKSQAVNILGVSGQMHSLLHNLVCVCVLQPLKNNVKTILSSMPFTHRLQAGFGLLAVVHQPLV